MTTIVIATGNAHKVEEFNRLAAESRLDNVRFVSAKEAREQGMPAVCEDSGTFVGNARLKARALQALLPAGTPVMADDSGLCVDALGGNPGVDTAYYAGPEATAAQNRAKLLAALEGVPATRRGAYFYCCLLLIDGNGNEFVFDAKSAGTIAMAESDGGFGFGYDPIFVPDGYDKTFAQLAGTVKDKLSHRGNAFQKLCAFLKAR
ncbi:MAG: RdgB/HAM1 family non-canonical purine NTP pyrophosphatase [Opitutales bacterium]|nr:RdgB/HAM1 family non-canonical purine NTP pyrophosphatase [Opitutales bacterium]